MIWTFYKETPPAVVWTTFLFLRRTKMFIRRLQTNVITGRNCLHWKPVKAFANIWLVCFAQKGCLFRCLWQSANQYAQRANPERVFHQAMVQDEGLHQMVSKELQGCCDIVGWLYIYHMFLTLILFLLKILHFIPTIGWDQISPQLRRSQ